jgi:hypothetical protein
LFVIPQFRLSFRSAAEESASAFACSCSSFWRSQNLRISPLPVLRRHPERSLARTLRQTQSKDPSISIQGDINISFHSISILVIMQPGYFRMANNTRICVICSEPFELRPDKPGFADRCLKCSLPKPIDPRIARQADRAKKRKSIEGLIRSYTASKGLAEAEGKLDEVAYYEKRIRQMHSLDRELFNP